MTILCFAAIVVACALSSVSAVATSSNNTTTTTTKNATKSEDVNTTTMAGGHMMMTSANDMIKMQVLQMMQGSIWTGNMRADMVINSLMFSFLIALGGFLLTILTSIGRVLKDHMHMTSNWTHFWKRAVRYIPEKNTSKRWWANLNEDFKGVMHFITKMEFTDNVSLTGEREEKEKSSKLLLNENAAPYPIMWKHDGKKHRIMIKIRKDRPAKESSREPLREIILTGPSNEILKAFVDKCYEDYNEYQQTANGRLNYNHRSGHRNGDMEWVADETSLEDKAIETVVLDTGVREDLIADISQFLESKERYKELGIAWARGYLLHGPPGTGKSSIIRALATHYNRHIHALKLSDERMQDSDLAVLLAKIDYSKTIVLIEDIDCLTEVVKERFKKQKRKRKKEDSDDEDSEEDDEEKEKPEKKKSKITLSGLLNALDGISSKHGRILFMTSNFPEKLDKALIRPGRVDYRAELGSCTQAQIAGFYKLFYKSVLDPEKTVSKLPDKKMSPAEISQLFMGLKDPKTALEVLLKKAKEESEDVTAATATDAVDDGIEVV